MTKLRHFEWTVAQFSSKFKYPVENHPTAQYEKGFKCLHVEGLSNVVLLLIHSNTQLSIKIVCVCFYTAILYFQNMYLQLDCMIKEPDLVKIDSGLLNIFFMAMRL
jgi:hypothetical protein